MKTENDPAPQAVTKPTLYLWLSCEGWVRFGPFRYLRWRTFPNTGRVSITDEKNQVIATLDSDGTRWRSTQHYYNGSLSSGWAFREPMITNTPHHPHPHRF